jgi:YesN/AraC family two-component response regulator
MHFREKIRISQLAEKIGISRSYLTKLMQTHYGLSPQEFLIKVRMENAAHFRITRMIPSVRSQRT